MRASTPAAEFQVLEAFRAACDAVFDGGTHHPPGLVATQHLLQRFAVRYRELTRLPRRKRRTLERRWKCALGTAALLLALGQAPSWAATIEVTAATPPSIKSDGRCSLIEAIVNANRDARVHLDCAAGAGADTIILPALSQQVLKATESLPKIWSRIVIEGRGSTVRRNATEWTSLNFVNVGASGNLTLVDTTISGATAGIYSGGYGGIDNDRGVLTLRSSTISDTSGKSGLTNSGTATLEDSVVSNNGLLRTGPPTYTAGGILNQGTMVVRNSTVTGNGAWFRGAGLFNAGGASLEIVDSVVSQNRITYEGSGGGLFNAGKLVLVRSTVSGNYADFGGGFTNTSAGTATLTRSTVSGNTAHNIYGYGWGGGINNSGSLSVTNSTVSGNKAEYGAGINLAGKSSLTLAHSTVTGNVARFEGGGLFVQEGAARLQRSIVSGNAAGRGREISNEPYNFGSGGSVSADDHNLFGHGGDPGLLGVTPGLSDLVPGKPLERILLALADNGGGTHTHALAIGSPALNRSPADAGCPKVDQRGNPRPRGVACDIGSFEGSAVLCGGFVTTMVGTVGPDELRGTPGRDVIAGLGGNDVIAGLDGNDVICGGAGHDTLYGGAGNDVLYGQGGNDRLFGHRGDDTLDGGAGQDECDGGLNGVAGDTATACETVRNVP
jgi:hypothetical protein